MVYSRKNTAEHVQNANHNKFQAKDYDNDLIIKDMINFELSQNNDIDNESPADFNETKISTINQQNEQQHEKINEKHVEPKKNYTIEVQNEPIYYLNQIKDLNQVGRYDYSTKPNLNPKNRY